MFDQDSKISLNVKISNDVRVGADVTIEHKTDVGHQVQIHDNCFIGSFSKIRSGVIIPDGAFPWPRLTVKS